MKFDEETMPPGVVGLPLLPRTKFTEGGDMLLTSVRSMFVREPREQADPVLPIELHES